MSSGSFAPAPPQGWIHWSSGTPSRRAVSVSASRTAAAWSTDSIAFMSFGYGKHTMRLRSDTVRTCSGSIGVGFHAPSLPAATSDIRDHIRADQSWLSANDIPIAARSAFSYSGYTSTGIRRPCSHAASWTSARGSGGGGASGGGVGHGGIVPPLSARSSVRNASAPTTAARPCSPAAMRSAARSTRSVG